MAKKVRATTMSRRREQAAAAMPEVRRLVSKFGLVAVANCAGKIKARDKELAALEKLKRDLAEREKALR